MWPYPGSPGRYQARAKSRWILLKKEKERSQKGLYEPRAEPAAYGYKTQRNGVMLRGDLI